MKTTLDPALALRVRTHDKPALEVRVNFGVFAGRHATPAEIDDLARALREEVGSFAIVAEQRHEFADDVEAAVHQVVIEIAAEHAGATPDALCERIVSAADAWATACIAARHTGLDKL
jgi:isocitrate lyase